MTGNDIWQIPVPHATLEVPVSDGSVIVLRRHGNPSGQRLVLCHGNGLAADLYVPFWSLLTNRFDLVIYDIRNHGWNTVSSLESHNPEVFIRDNECIVKAIDLHFGDKPNIGVFHSLSAITALVQESRAETFAGLVLYDPPIARPGISGNKLDEASILLGKSIRLRAPRFESRAQFSEVLTYSPSMGRVLPGVADLFARTTLRPAANGPGYELCCPPQYEAQAVEYIAAWTALVDFEALRCPTKVIGADPTLPVSFLPSVDISEIVQIDYDFIPESTHLLQLEVPEQCVAVMIEFLQGCGLVDTEPTLN